MFNAAKHAWILVSKSKQPFKCGLPQLRVELACRCVKFISKCLKSPNYVVRYVVKQGVYFQRLYSPIGRNTHHSVTMVDASLSDIVSNTRKLSQAWYAHHDTWLTESVRGKLKLISELLCIKHHYLKLYLFKADEVSVIIDFLCTT